MPTNIYTIYKHTSPSGKSYIGVTNQGIAKRFKDHIRHSKQDNNTHFCNAIRKYGSGNFISEELFSTPDRDYAYQIEEFFVSLYGTSNKRIGYNMTQGGDTGPIFYGEDHWNYGNTWSPEIIQKMSDAKKGKKITKECKKKMSDAQRGEKNHFYGKTHSDSIRKKISLAITGKIYTRVECIYCKRLIASNCINRWHNDNCKHKPQQS